MEFTPVGTGATYSIRSFIKCMTKHVVDLLICPCGLEYIERATHMLHIRLEEHIQRMTSNK